MRNQVKQRDGRCVACGRVEGLDAHHVDSFGAHGKNDPDRMVTLCRKCHSMWHSGDAAIRKAVERHLKRVTQPGWIVAVEPGISWQEIFEFPAI